MKKIRYYAPYWILALIIVAVIIYMMFFRFHPFSELPKLAATLESNEYFIREDGAIMINSRKTDAFPGVSPVDTHEGKRYKVRNPEAKPVGEMLPHEYAALICEDDVFVRKDGKVFTTEFEYVSPRIAYLRQLCQPSFLSEDALEEEIEITGKSSWLPHRQLVYVELRTPVEKDEASLNWYLSVKLSDGWYIISEGTHHSVIVASDGLPYFHISSSFPALHEGEYRLEFLIDGEWSYKEITLTRKDADTYTLNYD